MSNREATRPHPTPLVATHDSTTAETGGDRRAFLRTALAGSAAVGATLALGGPAFATTAPSASATSVPPASAVPFAEPAPNPVTARQALKRLVLGNNRWRAEQQQHPRESGTIRQTLVSGQQPFALILGCIDSRVPPELVFDQGLGDLMTVRSAGCVLDSAVLGSLLYGVLELNIPLIVTLGHQHCGAVKAAVHVDETGDELPEHIDYIAEQIIPAIDHSVTGDARVEATTNAHTRAVRNRLAAETDIAPRVADGRLLVVSARYQLTTQRVHHLA
ncbi:carbonic anhydrase [Streptomyces sp. SM12]|uniref:carbonic anhydrase n=1 Tax=Streptomyces sp. SM12 TaxID=1071602 RepID=UPI0015E17848